MDGAECTNTNNIDLVTKQATDDELDKEEKEAMKLFKLED